MEFSNLKLMNVGVAFEINQSGLFQNIYKVIHLNNNFPWQMPRMCVFVRYLGIRNNGATIDYRNFSTFILSCFRMFLLITETIESTRCYRYWDPNLFNKLPTDINGICLPECKARKLFVERAYYSLTEFLVA